MPIVSNPGGASGAVTSVTAADTSIVVAGSAVAKTVATGTLDVIATNHPPAAAVAMNGQKITGLANGTAATDAAAFGQIAAAGALVLLSSTVLGADGTFDISGISQAYSYLTMQLVVRGTRVNQNDSLMIRLNNDSGNNYTRWNLKGDGASATSASATAQSSGYLGDMPSSTGTANIFGVVEVWIPGYSSTTWNKVVRSIPDYNEPNASFYHAGVFGSRWASTAAVNRVTIFGLSSANLLAGSRLDIWGL